MRLCLAKERKWEECSWEERNWVDFLFSQVCLDEMKMRGKEIEEELFSLICLCGQVKKKKNIMISNDNFTLIWL